MGGDGAVEVWFAVNGLRIAAKSWGRPGNTPVLALHGWLDNAASFDLIAPQLPDCQIVAVDLPGHGRSSHRPDRWRMHIWDDVHELRAIVDELGWERFALIGHSRGAGIATLFAGTFPERVCALGLIEGLWPMTTNPEEAPNTLASSIHTDLNPAAKALPVYASHAAAIEARSRAVGSISLSAAEVLVARGLRQVKGGYTWSTDPRLRQGSPMRLSEAHGQAFARAVKAPVCAVLSEDGMIAGAADVGERLAVYPHLECHRLTGNHHVHLEADTAPAVAAALRPFLTGH